MRCWTLRDLGLAAWTDTRTRKKLRHPDHYIHFKLVFINVWANKLLLTWNLTTFFFLPSVSSSPPPCREAPCTMGDEDWYTPEVPESVLELFSSRNWTMDDPSPACMCSCDGKKKMLPDCPAGAGGLPLPEVRARGVVGRYERRTHTFNLYGMLVLHPVNLLINLISWQMFQQ